MLMQKRMAQSDHPFCTIFFILSEVEQIRKNLCNEVEGSVYPCERKRILRLRFAALRMT